MPVKMALQRIKLEDCEIEDAEVRAAFYLFCESIDEEASWDAGLKMQCKKAVLIAASKFGSDNAYCEQGKRVMRRFLKKVEREGLFK